MKHYHLPRLQSPVQLLDHIFPPFFHLISLIAPKSNLAAYLQLVCKFKFARYGHIKQKLILYVPQFKNLRIFDFQALDPKFVLDQALYLFPKGVL